MSNIPEYDGVEADSVFARSSSVWQAARQAADTMHALPESSLNLQGVLSRVPKLPIEIPGHCTSIGGFSTWQNTADCSLLQKHEKIRQFSLRRRFSTKCGMSSSKNFTQWDGSRNNGIALLVLGWAYILNASLAERQNICIKYQTSPCSLACAAAVTIELAYSSPQELAWWASITYDGWTIAGNQVFPWSVEAGEMGLRIQGKIDATQPPPTAKEAAQYLARLCQAYNLGTQCTAALAAALCLPLHSSRTPLKPAKIDLPRPQLGWQAMVPGDQDPPSDFQLLGYLMSLSLSPQMLGPCLWRVFWVPDVPCNLAGAWLGPIASVLGPIIEQNNLELLAKVLSFSRAAPLWLGIALTGKHSVVKSIIPFLTQARDYPDARPNVDSAAWSGQPQSFLDLQSAEPPLKNGEISRADIWRLRYDFHSQYREADHSHSPPYGWPPFGKMHAEDVELEIRNHLQCSRCWSYSYWTWFTDDKTKDPGFLRADPAAPIAEVQPPVALAPCNLSLGQRKNIQEISKRITKAIFWWSCDQVEKGFGNGKLVPFYSSLADTPQRSSTHHIDHRRIQRWIEDMNLAS